MIWSGTLRNLLLLGGTAAGGWLITQGLLHLGPHWKGIGLGTTLLTTTAVYWAITKLPRRF